MFAVGQDSHSHPALLGGLGQVVVDLLDVSGVGLSGAGGAQPALELHEGVQGGEVDRPPGGVQESEGGFSSTISWLWARPVRVRNSLTVLVMFASGSPPSWRRRISAAASRYLGSLVLM